MEKHADVFAFRAGLGGIQLAIQLHINRPARTSADCIHGVSSDVQESVRKARLATLVSRFNGSLPRNPVYHLRKQLK